MMAMECPNFITSPWRPTPVTRFCSIFNQLLQLFPRAEFQKAVIDTRAERHARGLHVLGPIRRDAVRATRARAFVARDLRRLGELRGQAGASRGGGPAPVDARVRQCAPAVAALSSRVLSGPGAVSGGRGLEAVPVQKQVAQPRCDGHRSVRGDVSVGGVSPHQRRGEAAFHARSRRVSADLPGDHRRQAPRGTDGAGADVSRRARSWSSTRATSTSPGSRS